MTRRLKQFFWPFSAAALVALAVTPVGGAIHAGQMQLQHPNPTTAGTSLTCTVPSGPVNCYTVSMNFGTAIAGLTTGGTGVFGSSTDQWGVWGSGARGVRGEGMANDGYGVYGTTAASGSYGVYGIHTGSGTGVVGTNSGGGYGVIGYSSNGIAMLGFHPAGGYAGYYIGNVHVAGTLSKSAGAFRIDHPLDPANKYLQHSFVESPEMKNVYDGVARTDGKGFATVSLPRYFGALNRDFRYQLTILGKAGWDVEARVWEEVAKNRFTIRTNKPGIKVSWQVTGIRKDAYANAHRIQPEVAKPADERGRYLHPELSGKPAAASVVRLPKKIADR